MQAYYPDPIFSTYENSEVGGSGGIPYATIDFAYRLNPTADHSSMRELLAYPPAVTTHNLEG